MIQLPAPQSAAMNGAGRRGATRLTSFAVIMSSLPAANAVVYGRPDGLDWIDLDGFAGISLSIRSDQPSATDGIVLEYSDDQTNLVPGGTPLTYQAPEVGRPFRRAFGAQGRYLRIRYTNGATKPTTFRLTVRVLTSLEQPTCLTPNNPITSTTLLMGVAATAQAPDSTGTFSTIGRHGTGADAHIINPVSIDPQSLAAVSTSAKQDEIKAKLDAMLAKQTDGLSKVQVTALPTILTSQVAGAVQLVDGTWATVKTARITPAITVAILSIGTGTPTIVPAVANRKILVLAYRVTSTLATSIAFNSNTTEIWPATQLTANVPFGEQLAPIGLFETAVGQPLVANLATLANLAVGVSAGVKIVVRYVEVP